MNSKVTFLDIQASQAGQKLIAFLQRNLRNQSTAVPLPLGLLHRLIRSGQVRVNKGRVKPDYILLEGDRLRLPPLDRVSLPAQDVMDAGAEAANTPELGACLVLKCPQIKVIAETADCLAVNKPGGIPVHGGSRHKKSIIGYVQECRQGEPGFTPTLAHRLDKDTSGVLLIAKTYGFLRLVQDSLKNGNSQKIYLVWAKGQWPHAGPIMAEDYLSKKADAKGAEKVGASHDGEGSLCKSEITPLFFNGQSTLLKIELLTGRTHQIRVQLALRGHAIVGDYKYGGPACVQGMLLHSYSFSIPGAGLEFIARPSWSGEFFVNQLDSPFSFSFIFQN